MTSTTTDRISRWCATIRIWWWLHTLNYCDTKGGHLYNSVMAHVIYKIMMKSGVQGLLKEMHEHTCEISQYQQVSDILSYQQYFFRGPLEVRIESCVANTLEASNSRGHRKADCSSISSNWRLLSRVCIDISLITKDQFLETGILLDDSWIRPYESSIRLFVFARHCFSSISIHQNDIFLQRPSLTLIFRR
jgi:hypothetical protein